MTGSKPANRPLAYRPTDAAELLGIGRTTLFSLLADGKIESFTIGRIRLISHESLEKFLQSSPDDVPADSMWLESRYSSSSTGDCASRKEDGDDAGE